MKLPRAKVNKKLVSVVLALVIVLASGTVVLAQSQVKPLEGPPTSWNETETAVAEQKVEPVAEVTISDQTHTESAPAVSPAPKPIVDRSAAIAACEQAKSSQNELYQKHLSFEQTKTKIMAERIVKDHRHRGLGNSEELKTALEAENARYLAAVAGHEATFGPQINVECR